MYERGNVQCPRCCQQVRKVNLLSHKGSPLCCIPVDATRLKARGFVLVRRVASLRAVGAPLSQHKTWRSGFAEKIRGPHKGYRAPPRSGYVLSWWAPEWAVELFDKFTLLHRPIQTWNRGYGRVTDLSAVQRRALERLMAECAAEGCLTPEAKAVIAASDLRQQAGVGDNP